MALFPPSALGHTLQTSYKPVAGSAQRRAWRSTSVLELIDVHLRHELQEVHRRIAVQFH